MGREVKRVPLDFDWPLNERWEGYLNPFYRYCGKCPACNGSGYSPEAQQLHDQWYGYADFWPALTGSAYIRTDDPFVVAFATRNIEQCQIATLIRFYGTTNKAACVSMECERLTGMWNGQWCHHLDKDDIAALIAADRLWDFTRVARTPEQEAIVKQKLSDGGNSWLPESNGYTPTPEEVNRWSLQGMGHDSINEGVCVRAKCERMGYAAYCTVCDGEGDVWDTSEHKAASEAWERVGPPVGDGWQLWETVSEGSPTSPVFPDGEALADWMVAEQGYSPQSARAFVAAGWAPSLIAVAGVGVWDGVTAEGIFAAKDNEVR
jgi:hypothetical protein